MTTYAAYYLLTTAQREQEQQAKINDSRRTSADSSSSKFSIKSALRQLRPTTEKLTPAGIYAPIINNGPLFSGLKPIEVAQEPSPMYQRERPLFGRSKKSSNSEKKQFVKQATVDNPLLR